MALWLGFFYLSKKKFVSAWWNQVLYTHFSDGVKDMTAAPVPDIMKSIGFLICVLTFDSDAELFSPFICRLVHLNTIRGEVGG